MLSRGLAVVSIPIVCAAGGKSDTTANPIRKVVSLLQSMHKKIAAEGEEQEKIHGKYVCYCQTAGADLQTAVGTADAKVPQVESAIKEGQSRKAQLQQELTEHQASRADAKAAMAKATSLRQKEAVVYKKESTDYKTNIAALTSAVSALNKGMTGAFLQGAAAQTIQKLALNTDMPGYDRQVLVSFLSGKETEGYVPAGGQIVGILKEMKDSMSKDLADLTGTENNSIAMHDELMAAKSKEVEAHVKAIEAKTVRVGDLGVEIVQMKADLSDTQQQLLADREFMANMDSTCAEKKQVFEEAVKLRLQELVAIADTIKMLNDDDALDLFKKTLPSASLLQVSANSAQLLNRALSLVNEARAKRHDGTGLDLIAVALTGRKVNFEKIMVLIDKLVATLKNEQVDDENKKEYCEKQLDSTDDRKKGLQQEVTDLSTFMEDAEEKISTLSDELKALANGLALLDKEVAEQTETRQTEHKEFQELMSSNTAAKELLGVAKNRLNKFYNPKLYNPPPKRVLSDQDQIVANFAEPAFVQIHAHQNKDSPPPPPAAVQAYRKRGQMSNGVIAMLDLLSADLQKEMTEADVAEKNGQLEYEQFMTQAMSSRVADSKAVTNKEVAKANTETSLMKAKDERTSKTKELMAMEQYISSLHGECDWLISNFNLRKEARAGEIESLNQAKAVLAGADFSLVQTRKNGASRSLRGL